MFVEKAYVLTVDNAAKITTQMSFGKSYDVKPAPAEQEKEVFEIRVSAEQIKSKSDALKSIFSKFPGDQQAVIRVGSKIIKTSYNVDGCEAMREELKILLN